MPELTNLGTPLGYHYRLTFDVGEQEWVATVDEMPSLSWLAADPADAITNLIDVVTEATAREGAA